MNCSRISILVPVGALLALGLALGLYACGGGGGSSPPVKSSETSTFPLHVDSSKRYLVDAAGKPFLLHGDSAWSLIADLSTADAEQYLEDRRQKGFNTVLVSLLEHKFSTHAPNNANDDPPFTTVPFGSKVQS